MCASSRRMGARMGWRFKKRATKDDVPPVKPQQPWRRQNSHHGPLTGDRAEIRNTTTHLALVVCFRRRKAKSKSAGTPHEIHCELEFAPLDVSHRGGPFPRSRWTTAGGRQAGRALARYERAWIRNRRNNGRENGPTCCRSKQRRALKTLTQARSYSRSRGDTTVRAARVRGRAAL